MCKYLCVIICFYRYLDYLYFIEQIFWMYQSKLNIKVMLYKVRSLHGYNCKSCLNLEIILIQKFLKWSPFCILQKKMMQNFTFRPIDGAKKPTHSRSFSPCSIPTIIIIKRASIARFDSKPPTCYYIMRYIKIKGARYVRVKRRRSGFTSCTCHCRLSAKTRWDFRDSHIWRYVFEW